MASSEVRFRPVAVSDAPFLWQLKLSTMKVHITQTFGWDEGLAYAFLWRTLPGAYVVEVADAAVGILKVCPREDHVFLDEIGLMPGVQRQGIGRAIVRGVLREASQRGLPVQLRVLRCNPAVAFYERLGFVPMELTPTHAMMTARAPCADAMRVPTTEVEALAGFQVQRGPECIAAHHDTILARLRTTYWAKELTASAFTTMWQRSEPFAVHDARGNLSAFGRAVTDCDRFAYLSDVWVDPSQRNQGLGRLLCGKMLTEPDLKACRWLLRTRPDTEAYYAPFGFRHLACDPIDATTVWMQRCI